LEEPGKYFTMYCNAVYDRKSKSSTDYYVGNYHSEESLTVGDKSGNIDGGNSQ